jgi:hypothetical protein
MSGGVRAPLQYRSSEAVPPYFVYALTPPIALGCSLLASAEAVSISNEQALDIQSSRSSGQRAMTSLLRSEVAAKETLELGHRPHIAQQKSHSAIQGGMRLRRLPCLSRDREAPGAWARWLGG